MTITSWTSLSNASILQITHFQVLLTFTFNQSCLRFCNSFVANSIQQINYFKSLIHEYITAPCLSVVITEIQISVHRDHLASGLLTKKSPTSTFFHFNFYFQFIKICKHDCSLQHARLMSLWEKLEPDSPLLELPIKVQQIFPQRDQHKAEG